jgi:hypothetical protein
MVYPSRTAAGLVAGVLRQKDVEQALILEEKMALQQKLLAAAGIENVLECPNYSGLVAEDAESAAMWQEVLLAVQVTCSVPFFVLRGSSNKPYQLSPSSYAPPKSSPTFFVLSILHLF